MTDQPTGKVQFGTQVPKAVIDAVRATVNGLQRRIGPEVTLSNFVTEALANHVRDAEVRYNKGEPFPTTDKPLLLGPRVGNRPGGDDASSP